MLGSPCKMIRTVINCIRLLLYQWHHAITRDISTLHHAPLAPRTHIRAGERFTFAAFLPLFPTKLQK